MELTKNGYPRKLLQQVLAKPEKDKIDPKTEPQTTCTIPYIRGVSVAIRRVLAPLKIRTVNTTKSIKWELMQRTKDRLPTDQIPGTIYTLECTDCSSVYIGETARTAKQRSKEHQMHTRTGHTELSTVANHANHAHKHGHNIQWTPIAKTLAREGNATKRKVKEALEINEATKRREDRTTMNQDYGRNISKLWLDLI